MYWADSTATFDTCYGHTTLIPRTRRGLARSNGSSMQGGPSTQGPAVQQPPAPRQPQTAAGPTPTVVRPSPERSSDPLRSVRRARPAPARGRLLRSAMAAVWLMCTVVAVSAPVSVSAGTVEVLHDNWGVPHIYATDNAAMAYGYGWSTAEDHGELCLSLYAGARCRSAQYYGGPGGGLLKSLADRFLLSFGARKLGETYYAGASDFARSIFDAYGAGFSA